MLVNKYKSLPLKERFFVSYSLPMALIFIIMFAVIFPGYYRSNTKSVIKGHEQNFFTCKERVGDYVSTLYTLSHMLENNATIAHGMEDGWFSTEQSMGEQYRSFWKLEQEMQRIVLASPKYRVGLYIPDDLVYAQHNIYFFSESMLRNIPDWKEIEGALSKNLKYSTTVNEIVHYNSETTSASYIAVFGKYTVYQDADKYSIVTKAEFPKAELERILDSAQLVDGSLLYLVDNNFKKMASSLSEELPEWMSSEDMLSECIQKIKDDGALNQNADRNWNLVKTKDGKSFYILSSRLDKYNWTLFAIMPAHKLHEANLQLIFVFALLFFGTMAVIVIVSYMLATYYVKRLVKLNNDITEFGSGKTIVVQENETVFKTQDEIDKIQQSFKMMAVQIQALMNERYKQGQIVASAQLKALQAQINPHFLYNTLDLINWEGMKYNAGNVSEIARDLGLFYRLSLNKGRTACTIEDELKHVQTYVNIENFHFDGAIHLEIIVPEIISKEYACLGIILQPFVENSIVHGIAEHSEIKECSITISATLSEDDKDILFDIRDNGPGFDEERKKQILNGSLEVTKHGGYGIRNINARLKLCYGDKYGIEFRSNIGKGTLITVRIRALTLKQLEERLK